VAVSSFGSLGLWDEANLALFIVDYMNEFGESKPPVRIPTVPRWLIIYLGATIPGYKLASGAAHKLCWPDYENWRRGWDSNPRYGLSPYNGLANRRLQPLGHPSTDEWIDAGDARAVVKTGSNRVNSPGLGSGRSTRPARGVDKGTSWSEHHSAPL
jgi:hypothetical protein